MKTTLIVILIIGALLLVIFFSDMKSKNSELAPLTITSTAFKNGESIPAMYTCDGKGTNPQISISGVSSSTKSLVLWMHDPDAPSGRFEHWILYNLPADTTVIPEGYKKPEDIQGKDYVPPCPPSGTHRYIISVFGVDEFFHPDEGGKWFMVEPWILEHTIQKGELMGTYSKVADNK